MQSTNELFLAAQQRILEEERGHAERLRNKARYLRWLMKGGPALAQQERARHQPQDDTLAGLERRRHAAGLTP